MAEKKIGIDIVADPSGYRRAADEAKKITMDLTADFALAEKAGTAIGGALAGIAKAVAIGVGAAPAALALMTKSAIDTADAMNDLSKKTGISVEELGAWRLATEKSGTSLESLALGLKSTANYMVDHRDRLDKLGITGKTASEVLIQLSGVISSLPADDPRRMALANDVLSRSYQDMMPLLAEGEDGIRRLLERGRELNPVTEDLAENADAFNDQLAELKTVSGALGAELASEVLPGMTDIAKAMTEAAKEAGILEAAWVGLGGVMAHILGLDEASQTRDRLAEVNQEIAKILEGLNGGVERTDKGIVGISEESKQKALQRLRDLGVEAAGLRETLGLTPKAPEPPKRSDDAAIDSVLNPPKKNDAANRALKEQQAALNALTASQQVYMGNIAQLGEQIVALNAPEKTRIETLQETLNGMVRMPPEIHKVLQAELDLAQAQNQYNEELARTNELMEITQQFDDAAAAQAQVFSDSYDNILRETEDLNVSLIKSDKNRAAKQLEIEHERRVSRIALMQGEQEDIDRLLEAEQERYETAQRVLQASAKDTGSFMKDLGATFNSAFEDAIVEGEKFSDVLAGLAQDIERLLVRRNITDPLTEGIDSWLSGLDFGSFFANADGGVYAGPGISAYSGQIVSRPTIFPFASGIGLMGEAGPEAILPLRRGADGKLGVQAGGSGGMVNHVNITVNTDVGGRTESGNAPELGRRLEVAVIDVLVRERRPGGLLAA